MILSGEASEMRMASKSARRVVLLSWKLGLIALHLLQHRFTLGRRQRLSRTLLRRDQLDVEAERLQLANEHVERFRQSGRERRVALDDRLVDLRAPGDVV